MMVLDGCWATIQLSTTEPKLQRQNQQSLIALFHFDSAFGTYISKLASSEPLCKRFSSRSTMSVSLLGRTDGARKFSLPDRSR